MISVGVYRAVFTLHNISSGIFDQLKFNNGQLRGAASRPSGPDKGALQSTMGFERGGEA